MYIDSGAESRSLNWGLERAFSGFGLGGSNETSSSREPQIG